MTTLSKPKQLLSALVALIVALMMATPASAATITINDAIDGQNYTAYKLFDVTTSGEAYAYSTTNSTLVSAVQNAEIAGITFTETTTSGTYNVTVDEDNFSAADFAAWISQNLNRLGLTVAGSDTGSDGAAKIENVGTGYFFVTSSTGSLCILNTASEDITIYEKNTVPTITKKVYEDSSNSYEDKATIDVIDTIKYQLTVNTGTNTNSSSTGINANYVITDVLPDGITYDEDTGVTIDGWTLNTDYSVSWDEDENTLTITLLSDGKLGSLAQNADIVITYEASADENLAVDINKENKVTLTYNNYTVTDSATVITYDIDGSAENNTFTKVDGSNNPLSGVKFVLSKTVTEVVDTDDGSETKEVTYYATFDTNGYLTGWVDTLSAATELVTDASGHIYAYGLDADTYILTETETLDGYNLLTETISVTIAEDGTVTYAGTGASSDGSSITVVNTTGSLLPGTGGMGTTVIYIVGALLVIGAGVALVVRLRNRHEC